MSEATKAIANYLAWESRNGELLVGGIPLTLVAERVGRTPFYVYARERIEERVRLLRKSLPKDVRLHYAMKANPMPALVQYVARLVDGIDVASAQEMMVALDAGMHPSRISFAGPGKSQLEVKRAVAASILLNIESECELRHAAEASRQLNVPARVCIRVNPDFELKSSGMKMGGGPKQFGIDAEQVPNLLGLLNDFAVQFEGFHIYSGSQNLKAESIIETQSKTLELAYRLAEYAPNTVSKVNLGGGFGIPYFPGDSRLDIERVGEALERSLVEGRKRLPNTTFVIELGRYLVGEAGIYVCRVIERKVSRGHSFIVTDGGLHHHLAASGNFGQVIRKNYPVAIGNRMNANPVEQGSIVGPLCTPLDLLGDRLPLPRVESGDLVVVFQSGAYGLTASPVHFLSHPAPAELLI